MARFTAENTILAREIIARYPRPKSALIPLLHLAQEQDGYVADDAMEHIAELVGVTPAEVLGTCSFYEMFKREPVGEYLVNVCTNISCLLLGGEELLHHLEDRLGIKAGGTTADGMFTIEDVECIAACTEAPVPPGELPLLLQASPPTTPTRSIDDLRARPPGARGAQARHARPHPPADPAPTAGRQRRARRRASEPVWLRTGRRRGPAVMTVTDAAADHHHPLRAGRRLHARAATSPPAATRASRPRSPRRPPRSATR